MNAFTNTTPHSTAASLLLQAEDELNEARDLVELVFMAAAQWLADQHLAPTPIVPAFRQLFGLSSIEACEASASTARYRTLRKAFA